MSALQGRLTNVVTNTEATKALLLTMTQENKYSTEDIHKTDSRVANVERLVSILSQGGQIPF